MDEETCPQTRKQQQKNTSFIGLAKRAGEPSKKKKNASDCDTFIHREKKDMTMTMPKERRRKIECELLLLFNKFSRRLVRTKWKELRKSFLLQST